MTPRIRSPRRSSTDLTRGSARATCRDSARLSADAATRTSGAGAGGPAAAGRAGDHRRRGDRRPAGRGRGGRHRRAAVPRPGGGRPAGGGGGDPRRRRPGADGRPGPARRRGASAAARRAPCPTRCAPASPRWAASPWRMARKAAEVARTRNVLLAVELARDDEAMDGLHRADVRRADGPGVADGACRPPSTSRCWRATTSASPTTRCWWPRETVNAVTGRRTAAQVAGCHGLQSTGSETAAQPNRPET